MAAFVDFSALTNDQKRLIQEMVIEEVLQNPDFNLIHTLYTGIRAGDRIGFAGEIGLMGKAARGCGAPTPDVGSSTGDSVLWTPNKWEVLLRECGADMDQSIKQWMLNFGNKTFDRTGTDYEQAIAKVLANGIIKQYWRWTWMNDKDAANYNDSPAGNITNGVDVTFFNFLDGFFKLLYDLTVSLPARRSTLAANAQATYALQESVFDAAAGYTALNLLETRADMRLRQSSDKMILCTKSVEDRYRWYLESKGQEPAYVLLTNGQSALQFRGIPLIAIPFWDEFIRAYEDNGTKYRDPHRAVLTTKANLAVGTQDTDTFSTFNMWYDPKEKYNWTNAIGDVDVHVLRPYMFQFSY